MDCLVNICSDNSSKKNDDFATEHRKQTQQSKCQDIADFLDPSYLFYDEPFTLSDWDKHQRWRRHCPKGLVCVRVAWGMKGPLIYFTLLAAAIGVYHEVFPERGWPSLAEDVQMTQIITATSFALALLMVFRTNSSYGRWWEARKTWGAFFTECRVMAKFARCYLNQSQNKQASESILRWIQALPYLVLYHLSVENEEIQCLRDDVQPILNAQEVAWLSGQPHKPLAGCSAITHTISKLDIHPIYKMMIENQLAAFAASFGACERILRQPIPQAYTRHTSRFLMLWLTILPFALWPALDWACIVFCPLISFVLLGIEGIGVQIEQPFHVLPLRQFCKVIRQNVLDLSQGIQGLENLPNITNVEVQVSNNNINNTPQNGINHQKELVVENSSVSKSVDSMV